MIKILIAEDNKSVQALYNVGLPDGQFQKKFVENGQDAVSEYEAWKPEIVILDLIMPLMSGYAALKAIREKESENGRDTTIIISTGSAEKNDIMDCAKLGMAGYILKPFKHRELPEKIESFHAKRRRK